ncbi:hypothetical protein GCM10022210_17890 [Mucilaginibacter dorajii]|uniref:Uncharacterized protein n=1 Tax=Mucilaginibacter dorajii TaxID=692994 RepID=A0ABP7PQ66_9SPHI
MHYKFSTVIKNKKAILGSQTPVFLFMMYLGVKGLIKGIDAHNTLRIAMSSAGLVIFITMYILLIIAIMRKASSTDQRL